MHVLFMAPNFPVNQRFFVRALHQVGARVTGIGDVPGDRLDPELRSWLHGYEHIPSLANESALIDAVRRVQRREWVDRLECTVEAIMLPTAKARAACTIPGLSVEQVILCRDKYIMKNFLREHGIPCARNAEVNNEADAWKFVREVGYPVVVKPKDGAGAHGTTRADNDEEMKGALAEAGLGHPRAKVAIEEFISGHEGFYDTLTVNGEVVFESICHYYPNVLEAMRTRWINPYVVVTNRVDAPGYGEVKVMGRRVIKALGLGTSPTHMEWFFGPKGLAFSEIGARPPGVRFWDLYCWANDFDLYLEWARAITHGAAQPRPSRRFSAGLLSLRPNQDGRIQGYSGLEEVQRNVGRWIGEVHLPPVGSRTADVGAGYMAHAWMHVRHPNYDECRKMLDYIAATVKVWAG
ncbi:MAG: ATP-grasp domain-containing protein [Deltaproteobacteria bacterium]|nr:ATP-grasp domain-containing protein [Deltaproteobacteria bacterium]